MPIPPLFHPPTPLRPPSLHCRSHRSVPRCSASTPDVLILGAGIAGLSSAVELALSGASVRVLESAHRPAALASAGMLAPHAEALPPDLFNLGLQSRNAYPHFLANLRQLVDADVGYVSRNDFLVPYMHDQPGDMLRGAELAHIEPALSSEYIAARRCPGDASLDSRKLMAALRTACDVLRIPIVQDAVRQIVLSPDLRSVTSVFTESAQLSAAHYVVATGAWTRKLLPHVPIRPMKGQMLSLAPPNEATLRPQHALHTPDLYVVPKNDGALFYVGATVEDGLFDTSVNAGGVLHLLSRAIRLVPVFEQYQIKETWAGLRPTSPDLQPILGASQYHNCTIATGFYRNGMLLAPVVSKIVAALAIGEPQRLSPELHRILSAFSYSRFLSTASSPADSATDDNTQSWSMHSSTPSNTQDSPTHRPSAPPNVEMSNQAVESTVHQAKSQRPKVLLYEVQKDGSQKPVAPSEEFQKSRAPNHPALIGVQSNTNQSPYDDNAPVIGNALDGPSCTDTSNDSGTSAEESGVYQGGAGYEDMIETREGGGSNDAYDLITSKRANADEVMSRALAANRAFGRKKSALETDGSATLSLTDEEVAAFDKAAERGLQDMRDFGKYFDPNDKSVLATRAELERDNGEFPVSMYINGSNVSSGVDSINSSETSGGYY